MVSMRPARPRSVGRQAEGAAAEHGAAESKVTKVTADDATATVELTVDITASPDRYRRPRRRAQCQGLGHCQEASFGDPHQLAPRRLNRLSCRAPRAGVDLSSRPSIAVLTKPGSGGDGHARSQGRGRLSTVPLPVAHSCFRVADTTSTLWGIVGIALIGGALLVMIGAGLVRPVMSDVRHRVQDLTKRYNGLPSSRASFSVARGEIFDYRVRTVPARRRPS